MTCGVLRKSRDLFPDYIYEDFTHFFPAGIAASNVLISTCARTASSLVGLRRATNLPIPCKNIVLRYVSKYSL